MTPNEISLHMKMSCTKCIINLSHTNLMPRLFSLCSLLEEETLANAGHVPPIIEAIQITVSISREGQICMLVELM